MSRRIKLSDRLLGLFGLDMDFSVSLGRDLLNPIAEDLYLGSRPRRKDLPTLQALGITHVVSCLLEADRRSVAFLGDAFPSLFVPLRDGMHEDAAATFPDVFAFLDAARGETQNPKVLVHCEAGVSRSATLVTAAMMRRTGGAFFPTYCEIRSRRREVLPNIGFATQLQRLEFEMELAPRDRLGPCSLAKYLHEACAVPVEIEVLQDALRRQDYDALAALQSIFGDEIPRVIQGVRG